MPNQTNTDVDDVATGGSSPDGGGRDRFSPIDAVIRFSLENKLVVVLVMLAVIVAGVLTAPFDWELGGVQRFPVPVDAIPDIGENQQIVFTEWMGRSPQDVEDQITYPLTVSLLGIPGVRTIRSNSFFGFSSINVIFEDGVEFYWSRTRVLEKLNSLPAGTLPEGVQPALGPDATALGQIFWYTLEGRDPDGRPVGGWDLHELRSVQDFYVRYALQSAGGIAEVASIGGFVREYQIDVDPDAMRAANVDLHEIYDAVRQSNLDVGARTIEMNKVEYIVRGIGFVKDIRDLETTVVAVNDNVPISIKDVGTVTLGPALRRGALDKQGAEAVGGVAVVRYGFNPLEAIGNVKDKIDDVAPGLPVKAIVDNRQTTPEEIREFAYAHGFQAYRGDDLNQEGWLEWLRSRKVKVDFARTNRADVEKFAAARGFEAFSESELNQQAWLKWLNETPTGERPGWLITPRDQWPGWINTSRITVVPFYDRTGLIYETLGTLNTALLEEILVTIIVVLVSLLHLRSSILISSLLPLAVLMCFIAMKVFGVDANVVALSGIAIAIGTMVDMGIILNENILKHLDEWEAQQASGRREPAVARNSGLTPTARRKEQLEVIFRASSEVGSAVLTAVATTVVSFLPVFTMTAQEGKLFRPLAFTKTFALIASVIVALTIIPPLAHLLFRQVRRAWLGIAGNVLLILLGVAAAFWIAWWAGAIVVALGAFQLAKDHLPPRLARLGRPGPWVVSGAMALLVGVVLSDHWLPLGPEPGLFPNVLFVAAMIGSVLLVFQLFERRLYAPLLRWCLAHKLLFLLFPALTIAIGGTVWVGFDFFLLCLLVLLIIVPPLVLLITILIILIGFDTLNWMLLSWFGGAVACSGGLLVVLFFVYDRPERVGLPAFRVRETRLWTGVTGVFPGLGKEFMPPLDEGSFLYMPSTMAHASIGESLDVLQMQDRRLTAIPEVKSVVGKIGRVDSPLDPAPIAMVETVIAYHPEYVTDKDGRRIKYRYDEKENEFARVETGNLIPDPNGRPYRLWGDDVKTPDDIWKKIVEAGQIPGSTSAPKLQPIATRLVMLQTGMRAPMGVKVTGPTLESIEKAALDIERFLKQVPSVEASAVIADRIVGKPYVEIEIDREAIARYGLQIGRVQDVIEVAIGGRRITTTVEGRERYPVRVRYLRELRDDIDSLGRILVAAPDGAQIPLEQLAEIRYVRGPQAIKSEDTFLIGYVLFDMKPRHAEVDVVQDCDRFLKEKEASGELVLPPAVNYKFAGNYENQQRSQKTLMLVLPLALFAIFLILYFQFKSPATTLLVFSGIAVAWAGGFLMIWLYGQPWFLDFSLFGTDMQTLFQVHPINMSVAIWVGFLALFGIATDDGVVIATYLDQSFRRKQIDTIAAARAATVEAGRRRVRPCLMTIATTVLALLPVLTSTGRGSDIMVPMAIPSFGGMCIAVMTMLVVPVLYCWVKEFKLRFGVEDALFEKQDVP